MKQLLSDAHTHSLMSESGIISLEPREAHFLPGKVYSVGIHPWSVPEAQERDLELLERLAAHPQVVALGETGLDRLRGGDLMRQMDFFKRHIELSESNNKPLIIHNVRSVSELLAARKRSGCVQAWIFHGYRGNAKTAKVLTDAGIYLSFGEKFIAGVPQSIPHDMILAETDMSLLPIDEIASRVWPEDPGLPGRNLHRLLNESWRKM